MNLLIEQRPRKSSSTISSTLLSDGNNDNVLNSSSLSSSSSVSASSSSASASSLVLKLKRQTTSQTSRMTGEDDEEHDDQHTHQQQQLQSRSTRVKQRSQPPSTGTARRPSSPAFNGRQQSTKRSITIDNNNNDLPSHVEEISSTTKRFKSDSNHTSSSSSSNKVDACVETVSIGLATEPDQLGPCEPGTSVVLEGIVWNETDSGVLVVNVTWRGKTYVGTLLDSTKQDWACPRLTCESPTSDYDPRSSSKTSRTKRATAGGTSRSSNANASVSSFQQISSIILSSGLDDRKLRHNIKSRQSKRLNHQQSTTINEENTASPSPLASPHRTNQSFFPSETTTTTSEATLIPCSEANCHKRFTSTVALSYHLSDAHKTSSPSSSSSSSSNNAPPPIVSQANRRDEEDVAHILANVAHYARRSSPPPPAATAERHPLPAASSSTTNTPTALTWPCPQISSNLVQTSSLNNDEREKLAGEPIVAASNLLDQTPTNEIDLKTNHSPSTNSTDSSPWNGENKKDRNNNKKRSKTTPVPSGSNSSFVPITLPSTIPLTSSSPAYSDISDEEPSSNPTEPILPPSTINLLSATHSNLEEKTPSTSTPFLPNNTEWTTQMLFQPFGPYISPSSLVPSTNKETNQHQRSTTPNGLNSKNHCSPNSDATVKNILDTRRSSTIPTPSSPPINLYHFHSNGTTGSTTNFSETTKFSPSIINTLTSPNENLLHPSSTTTPVTPTSTPPSTFKPMDLLDYSFNPSNGQYAHSSSLHPSR